MLVMLLHTGHASHTRLCAIRAMGSCRRILTPYLQACECLRALISLCRFASELTASLRSMQMYTSIMTQDRVFLTSGALSRLIGLGIDDRTIQTRVLYARH